MQTNHQKAFTMVELIFVIVIIGILSAIAIPKLSGTVNQVRISKGKSTLAAARSALATERQKGILRGKFDDIASVSANLGTFTVDGDSTPRQLLATPVRSGCEEPGCWKHTGTTYTFYYSGGSCAFELDKVKYKLTGSCGVFGY